MGSGSDKTGKGKNSKRALATRLTHAARDRKLTQGGVNPVVQRASTVLVESASKLFEPGGWTYGRHGTATHQALRAALAEIENAEHCAVVESGLLACTLPFIAFAQAGAHVLLGDNKPGHRPVDDGDLLLGGPGRHSGPVNFEAFRRRPGRGLVGLCADKH